jgi:hypothetical protein
LREKHRLYEHAAGRRCDPNLGAVDHPVERAVDSGGGEVTAVGAEAIGRALEVVRLRNRK